MNSLEVRIERLAPMPAHRSADADTTDKRMNPFRSLVFHIGRLAGRERVECTSVRTLLRALPTLESATRQVWKPALHERRGPAWRTDFQVRCVALAAITTAN